MASGDVTKVAVLGRFLLPGGGNTTTGAQRQNKVLLWGEITCTAADAGININASGSVGNHTGWPNALGLDVLDIIECTLKTPDPTGQTMANDKGYLFSVSHSGWLIHHTEDAGSANPIPITSGDDLVLTFWAIGDKGTEGVLT
jgi:hypothetical protein